MSDPPDRLRNAQRTLHAALDAALRGLVHDEAIDVVRRAGNDDASTVAAALELLDRHPSNAPTDHALAERARALLVAAREQSAP